MLQAVKAQNVAQPPQGIGAYWQVTGGANIGRRNILYIIYTVYIHTDKVPQPTLEIWQM